MMMKELYRKYHWLTVFILVITIQSCEMTIPVEFPDQEPKLVMNSVISEDTLIWVHVSSSIPIKDADIIQFIPESNAEVLLFENNIIQDTLIYNPIMMQYFSTTVKPLQNRNYRLEISANGYDAVSAETSLPPRVPIDRVQLDYNVREDRDGNKVSDITLEFTDPSNEENFYMLWVVAEDDYGNYQQICYQSTSVFLTDNDIVLDDFGESYYCNQVYFDDRLINGKTQIKMSTSDLGFFAQLAGVHVYLTTLSKDLYRYTVSSEIQERSIENPFAEPAIVFNNVTNGFGIFGGFLIDSRFEPI